MDERKEFETWLAKEWPTLVVEYAPLNQFYKGDDGAVITDKWEGWQARAQVAQLDVAAKQAVIDYLMMEYCPDEITPVQLANWEAAQRKVVL